MPVRLITPLLVLLFSLLAGDLFPLHAQLGEICGNQLDDDGDGLVDCQDEDCDLPYFVGVGYGSLSSRAVSLGDVDGDGDLDAWVANSGAN
ncbi:MAG: hypothetical protein ACO4CW_11850, partial [Planctomycetota bacterium]